MYTDLHLSFYNPLWKTNLPDNLKADAQGLVPLISLEFDTHNEINSIPGPVLTSEYIK